MSIAVAPANPSVAKGLAEQFTATGTYTDGSTANLTTQVDWVSGTNVGGDDLEHRRQPRTGFDPGDGHDRDHRRPWGITSPSDTLTVTAAALTSIAVAPANPSVAKGLAEQFTATGTYTMARPPTSPRR